MILLWRRPSRVKTKKRVMHGRWINHEGQRALLRKIRAGYLLSAIRKMERENSELYYGEDRANFGNRFKGVNYLLQNKTYQDLFYEALRRWLPVVPAHEWGCLARDAEPDFLAGLRRTSQSLRRF